MLFTPNYTVSYKGVFHPAGKPFDIDPKDRTEMERHGKVVEDKPTTLTEKTEPVNADISAQPAEVSAQPAKKGRPRKVSA